ncbi:hypothetical protein Pdw03_5967 [Penicillium digitatum]|uniref:Uncharacterized protein n=1 Tax=Penicillium digitatum TaxID=36651 RepID=A0A7T6XWC9_PENDI|nr:hypothetical protein Pdw03_5967 [Penicillium digitatum]
MLKNEPTQGRAPCERVGKHLTSRHASRPEAKIAQLLFEQMKQQLNRPLNNAGLLFESDPNRLRSLILTIKKCALDFLLRQHLSDRLSTSTTHVEISAPTKSL